ncbi:hypothetical protein [Tessaracoccus coleopterorum]|uniref:hypothetical protein n=1 Tax=Tessaracoccus coleopterorum TaxID=2714950 RepID=UPI0018D3A6FE|nr:hypothetical protein [Tessaracoccus coleopterorum]
MTDGHENASKEWTHPAVKALIEQQEGSWSWTFSYLGANQDAIEVGASIGISPTARSPTTQTTRRRRWAPSPAAWRACGPAGRPGAASPTPGPTPPTRTRNADRSSATPEQGGTRGGAPRADPS